MGEDECFGNRLHLCAKQKYGKGAQLDKWVACVMTNLNIPGKQSHDRDTYANCDAGTADELTQCASGDDSLEMLKQAGGETAGAAIQQAPWVVLSTTPNYNIQGEFAADVCSQMGEQGGQPACLIAVYRRERCAQAHGYPTCFRQIGVWASLC